jgi:predicted transcriptional regulator
LEDAGFKPMRRNLAIVFGVVLLATSGIAFPLSEFTVRSAPASGCSCMMPGIIDVAPSTALFNGKVLVDGVASVFVVAPPLAYSSPRKDEYGKPVGHLADGGLVAALIVGRPGAIRTLHTQELGLGLGSPPALGQGLGPSAQWVGSSASSRVGLVEPNLAPSTSASVTNSIPKIWWDFSQRRSRFEIYVEILELMKQGPMTPFEIAFYARLNHKRTREYTEFLEEASFLQAVIQEGKTLYTLTKEGRGFLDRVQSLLAEPRITEASCSTYQRDF